MVQPAAKVLHPKRRCFLHLHQMLLECGPPTQEAVCLLPMAIHPARWTAGDMAEDACYGAAFWPGVLSVLTKLCVQRRDKVRGWKDVKQA